MKAAFLTLGCKLNYAETSTYERGLCAAGYETVDWSEKADVYVINTCTVTATSDAKSRNIVRKAHRCNPDAAIYVVGCSASIRPSDYEGLPGVRKVFGCNEKSSLVPHICSKPCPEAPEVFGAYSVGERTRAFLKVQDGCDNYCKYCTVPYARGHSRNIPIEECVRYAREIAATGTREIVLTGVNTGDFGRSTSETFLDLLKALNEVEGIERYRISSIEPNLLSDEIIDWIASGTKFLPHFHIPLQSGSDRILKEMGRRYTTGFFASKIEYIRDRFAPADVFFGIDVMAGLPGESEVDFESEIRFLETIRPAFIHVFPYSRRPGTPAASMPCQVREEVKRERVDRLEALSSRLHAEFVGRNRGKIAKVLWESKEKDGTMGGYTENYIRVSRPYDAALAGKTSDYEI